MRRKGQQLTAEACQDVLRHATAGVLALQGDGGYPYAVPLSYVYDGKSIYFHSALQGHKVDAIRQSNKCSFCVIEQDDIHPAEFTTYYRSVIAFGRISIISDEEEKLQALRLLGRHYAPNDEVGLQREIDKDYGRVLMLRLDIEHLTGKEAKELKKQTHNKTY